MKYFSLICSIITFLMFVLFFVCCCIKSFNDDLIDAVILSIAASLSGISCVLFCHSYFINKK